MTDKNIPDINSNAFREGFRNVVEGYNRYNPYSVNIDHSGYIDCEAGLEHGRREIKMYGKKQVRKYFRFKVCSSAVGKPMEDVKKIIRLFDGSIPRYEFDAILLYLNSSIETFNLGVLEFINGKPISICESVEWNDGYNTAELAVKLHGKEAVLHQVSLGR